MAGTNPRSVNDWDRQMPKKDNFGKIGHEEKRWAEGWFVDLYGTPYSYSSTMTGNETFTDSKRFLSIYFLDPNGSDRNFNPSGTFRDGCVVLIKNIDRTGGNVIFDSTSSKQLIGPGRLQISMYDGTQWR